MERITLVSYFINEVSMKHLTGDKKKRNGKINLNIGSNEEEGKIKLDVEVADEYKEIKKRIIGYSWSRNAIWIYKILYCEYDHVW